MTDRFDLEQQILNCWHVVDDVKALANYRTSHKMSEEELNSVLLGVCILYQLKFEILMEMFEKMVHKDGFN